MVCKLKLIDAHKNVIKIDGRFKRFMEVWRDNDDSNPIMRR